VGTTSGTQNVTISNTGTVALNITSIVMSGANSGDFAQTNTCGGSLAAGANCSVSATFTPSASGSRSTSLTITDNASPATQTVTLSGNGTAPSLSLSATALSYGTVGVGNSSSQVVTVSNTGTGSLSITSMTISGANPGDYSQTNTCSGVVAASGSCSVTIVFTPQASGQRTATLSIYSNASSSPSTISLTGTGGAPTATLAPTSDAFGTISVGTTSTAMTNTLTNTSTNGAILAVNGFKVAGANPGDFGQTNNCPASLAPSASCTISITFTPTATGSRTATLGANVNTQSGQMGISLGGSGK
jgi:hypothetical protein